VCCEHGQETLKTDAFLNLKVKSKSLVTSATSGTFRDFWKNDDEKNRFLFLYLWVILTFMSMIGGRNKVKQVSKLLFTAFGYEYLF